MQDWEYNIHKRLLDSFHGQFKICQCCSQYFKWCQDQLKLAYMGIMSNHPCSTIVCSLRFSQICSRVLSLEKMTIHWRRNRLHVNSCKSRHLLFQFWAKTSHFGGQPPVSSLPPLIHTWCISPAQSLKHHHIASLCKALFFPQMICSAAAG